MINKKDMVKTTIQISEANRKILRKISGEKDVSYDELIGELIMLYHRQKRGKL
jgi:hypothetical protein